ncbi:hypothetical protein F7R21_22325 [Burkholderia latens]|uniref:AMP-binding enzyme C-terminal domain-containing protein n=1 Tax=Burkholderia latens TaxID=488446 RepID=A0A6H9SMR4_9BURK|nr:hypothetical protein F7R21_22325 [Burkholderia latens]
MLYSRPAVREAAVVGAADSYRGETAKAVVSLTLHADVSPDALIACCNERMAAFKPDSCRRAADTDSRADARLRTDCRRRRACRSNCPPCPTCPSRPRYARRTVRVRPLYKASPGSSCHRVETRRHSAADSASGS